MKHILSFLFTLTSLAISAHAQQKLLQGQIRDKQTGELLPNATISFKGPRGVNVVSGLNGTYYVRSLPTGDYTIRVNYVGYKQFEGTYTVTTQRQQIFSITLEPNKNDLTEIIVAGKHDKGSDAYALLAGRRADLIQNAVSSKAIEISPDLSVANVTQRVSGISLERSTNGEGQYAIVRGMDKRYIYTLVNGIKIPSPDNKNRYVPLDIFPADLLDRLEVSKSLSPNMEGDGIGGAINMIMKNAPEKFSVKANVAAGYADKFISQDFNKFSTSASPNHSPRYNNGAAYQATTNDFTNDAFTYKTKHNPIAALAGVSVGGRMLNNKLGILVAGSFQNNYRNVYSVFFNTETDRNNGDATVEGIQTRNYSIQQQRSGIHTRLDYQLNNNHRLSAYAGYMNLMRNEFRFVSDTNLKLGRVGLGSGRISNSYRTLHEVQKIANTTIGGEQTFTRIFQVNWTAAWSKAIGNRPDEATLNLVTGVSKDPATGKMVEAPLNLDGTSYRQFAHSIDEDKNGYLNLIYQTQLGAIHATWSAGGMYRNKTRKSQYDSYSLRPTPGIQVYNGDINNNTFSVFNGEGTSDNALNYTTEENVGAAYGMVKLEYNKLQVTGGARYENTDLTWNSNVPESVKGKTGSISYYDVLPSAHIKYSLDKTMAIRASYYSAISRPNFYEVVPHTSGDPDADYVEIGNPNLKRTTADNFDLRYELYPKGLDQLLAGVFYKRLKNPIEYALEDEGTNTYYLPDNFGNATNYGFELDLAKYFRWFGIKANYTFTDSRITTSKVKRYSTATGQSTEAVDQTRPLQGQSKHIANLSLMVKHDNIGLNAQLAFNYTGRRINTVSQFLNNDIWQKGFAQMDFSVEKKLARRWFVYAKINNILNTPYELEIRQPYTGNDITGDVPHQSVGRNVFVRKGTYGANYLLGVKFKL
ncbi:TonB-dependent receptor domain-containing protein [Niastella sp. OAS944]|uniref:TonB-dependent receptor n=1 Tax=Niastella sp. OAS944 TaxID=2664089 RepID=UPI00349A4B58|nr:outer membrane receptor protein involved in Fe transport [Chitinophagaceae bacterium OAS944]